jgi:hypothetical protein
MDVQGNQTGPGDPGDWGCIGGTAATAKPFRGTGDPVPLPTDFCLYPAAPNPVVSVTRLALSVPQAQRIRVVVYAKQGHGPHNARVVRTLIDGTLAAGLHEIHWDATDDGGVRLPPDLYRVVMETEGGVVCGDLELR